MNALSDNNVSTYRACDVGVHDVLCHNSCEAAYISMSSWHVLLVVRGGSCIGVTDVTQSRAAGAPAGFQTVRSHRLSLGRCAVEFVVEVVVVDLVHDDVADLLNSR